MRGERGAASLLGVVLTLLILVMAAWFFMKNTGFIGSGSGEEEEQTPIDQAVAAAVLMELRTVKQGLELYRTSSTERVYPASSAINDLETLQEVLPDVFPLPEELSFDFVSYVSTAEDEFLLKVRARDSLRTMYEVGSGFGPRKANP
jgi:hypothetical protein